MKPDILYETLAYLKQLPANSPEWEIDVPAFLSSITELSEEKAAERVAAASRENLTTILSEFRDRYSRQLDYFELDTSDWTAPTHSDTSTLAKAHSLLGKLSSFFDEYSSIPERGPSLTLTRHLNKKREEIEGRILRAKSELAQVLTTDSGPYDAPRKPTSDPLNPTPRLQAEAPEVSTNATLSDLHLSDGVLEFAPAVTEYSIDLADGVNDLSVIFKTAHASATVMATLERPDGTIVDLIGLEDGVCDISGLGDGRSILSLAVTAEDGVTYHTYRVSLIRHSRWTSDDVIPLKGLRYP